MGIQAKETDRNWITWILALGVFLRFFQAFQTIEILHPDEHYQTLEPAARLVWGIGVKTWEWDVGLRSWFTPALLSPLLFLANGLGNILRWFTHRDDSGLIAIYLSRCFISFTSCVFLFQMKRLLTALYISKWGQVLGIGCLALSPEWIVFGSATLTDTLALNSLWIGISLVVKWIKSVNESEKQIEAPQVDATVHANDAKPTIENKIDWVNLKTFFGIGFLITLPFLFRIQTLAFSLPFLASILLIFPFARLKYRYFAVFFGSLSVILIQGLLDLVTWGHFLHSVRTNVSKNLIEGVASHYGVEHWSFFLKESIQSFGLAFFLINLSALLIILNASIYPKHIKLSFTNFLQTKIWAAVILFGSVAYVMVHHLIPHKENRFLLPALPGLLVFSISILDTSVKSFSEKLSTSSIKSKLKIISPYFAILSLLGIATYSIQRMRSTDLYPSSNMSNLMIHIKLDGGLHQTSDPCILLLRHYWVWTHGELLQHMHYDMFEKNIETVTAAELNRCPYAVVLPQEHDQFEIKTAGHFVRINQNPRGYMLYKRKSP